MKSIFRKVTLVVLSLTIVFALAACRRASDPALEAPDVLMRVVDGVVQYQVAGEDHWRNLISVDDLRGADAPPAVGVRSASVNARGELILHFTDGTTDNLGVIRGMPGEPGQDALAVRRTAIDEFGQLLIFFTDNTFINLGVVQGSIGVDGEQGLSAFELYQRANPFYSRSEDQWFFEVVDGRISSANFLDVMTVQDLEYVAANMPEVSSVQLQDDITGNVTLTRPLDINFNGYDIKGNLTINSEVSTAIVFRDTFSGDKGVITGNLTLNMPNASLTNNIVVEGNVVINAVANATYRGRAMASKIIMNGPGRLDLTADFSHIPVDITTDKDVILQGHFDLVSVGAINANVLVTGSTIITTLNNFGAGARVVVTHNGRIDFFNHNVATILEVDDTASVVTPSGVGVLNRGDFIFVTFNVNPANASFVLHDEDGNVVPPISGRRYRLLADTDYFYSTNLFSFRPIDRALFNGSTNEATINIDKMELLTVDAFLGSNNTLIINFNRDVYVEDGGDYIPIVEAWGNVTPATILSWLLKEGPLSIGDYYTNAVDLDAFFTAALGEDASVTDAGITKVLSPRSIQLRFNQNVISSSAITTAAAVDVLLPLNMQFFRLQDETPFFGESVTAVAVFTKSQDTVFANLRSLEQHSQVSLAALTAQINALPNISNITLNAEPALVSARAFYAELDANPFVGVEYLNPTVKQRLVDLETFVAALENNITPVAIAVSNATGTAVSVRAVVTRVISNSLFYVQELYNEDVTGPAIAIFAPTYSFRINTLQTGDLVHVVGVRDQFNGLRQISSVSRLDILDTGVATPSAITDISAMLSDTNALNALQGQRVSLDEFLIASRTFESNGSITLVLRHIETAEEITLRYDQTLALSAPLRTLISNLQIGQVLDVENMVLGWFNGPQLQVNNASEFSVVEEISSDKLEAYLGLQLPTSSFIDVTLPTVINVGGWALEIEWASSDEAALTTQGGVTLGNSELGVTMTANITATGISTGAIELTHTYNITLPALTSVGSVASAPVNTQVAFEGVITHILTPNIVLVQTNNDGGILVWNEANNGRFNTYAVGDEILVVGRRQNVDGLHVVNIDSPINRLARLATGEAISALPEDISVALNAARGQRVSLDDFFIESISTVNNVTTLELIHLTHGTITVSYNRLVPGNATNVAILNSLLVGDAISITNAALVLPQAGQTNATLYLSNASEFARVTPSALHFEAFARRALNIPANVFGNVNLVSSFTQGQRTFVVTWASLDLEWMNNQGVISRPALGTGNASLTLQSALILNGETFDVLDHAITIAQIEAFVPYVETGFESSEGFPARTNYTGTHTSDGTAPYTWTFFYGTATTTGNLFGAQSAQMRWYASTPDNIGFAKTNFQIDNLRQIQFNANSTGGNHVEVLYSTDGTTWNSIGIYTLSDTQRQITIDTLFLEPVQIKFRMALPENAVNASRLTIDNVVFRRGETNFTTLLEREFDMPEEALPGQRIPLVTSFVMFDGKTYDVTWTSADTSIISIRGLVRQPDESQLNVTLTATITQNGEFVDEFDYVVTVLGRPLSVTEALARTSGTTVRVEGVVTSILTNLNAVIEDDDNAIVIRLSSAQLARLSIGDRVIMAGDRSTFNTIEQVVNQSPTYVIEIVESNVALPAAVDGNTLDLSDNNVWGQLRSQRIDLEDVIVLGVVPFQSAGSLDLNIYLPLFDREFVVRYDHNLDDTELSAAINALQEYNVIQLDGVVVSWFGSNPRLLITNTNQLVTGASLSLDAFEAYLENIDIFNIPSNVTSNLSLPTSLTLFGYDVAIEWTSSNTDFVAVDGTVTRPAIGEPNEDVTLTAVLTYADTQTKIITIETTVMAESLAITYVETFAGTFGTGNVSSYLSREWTSTTNGFEWEAEGIRIDQGGSFDERAITFGQNTGNFVRTAAPIAGGISRFSFEANTQFAGSATREVTLFINGVAIESFDVTSTRNTFELLNIDISGPVIIELRNTGGERVTIHNLEWVTFD